MGVEYSAAELFGAALHFKQAGLSGPFIGGYVDTRFLFFFFWFNDPSIPVQDTNTLIKPKLLYTCIRARMH